MQQGIWRYIAALTLAECLPACMPAPSPSAAGSSDATAGPVESGADAPDDSVSFDGAAPQRDAATAAASSGNAAGGTGDAAIPGTDAGSPVPASAPDAQTSGPDSSPPLPACGSILALTPCLGMAVLQGGDGFVGTTSDGGAAVYDTNGNVVHPIPGWGLASGVSSAAQAGGVTAAALVGGVQDSTFASLSIDTGVNVNLTGSSVFAHLDPNVVVRDDGRVYVAENELQGADGGMVTQPIPVIRVFDKSGNPVGVQRPSVPSYLINVGGALLIGPGHALYMLLSTPDMSTVFQGMVIAFDANLVETRRWTSPMNVVPGSFALTPNGSVVVAGWQVLPNVGSQGWIDALDGTTLAPVWTAPRMVGTVGTGYELMGVGVAPSGRIFAAGADGALSLWVVAFDPSGSTVWPQRVATKLPLTAASAGQGPIAVQQSGALLFNGGFELVPCP